MASKPHRGDNVYSVSYKKIWRGASPGNQDENRCCRRYAALFYFFINAINVVAPMGL